MLALRFQPLETVLETQFPGMTFNPVSVAELEEARHSMVNRFESG